MAVLSLQSIHNVQINLDFASLGERILAYLIDSLIKFGYFFVVMLTFADFISVSDSWSRAAITLIILSPIMFYTVVSEMFMSGQTIGKKALKIKVVKLDDYQTTYLDFFIRWIFNFVDILFTYGAVAFLSIAFSKKHQRLGDIVAGTVVIKIKRSSNLASKVFVNLESEYQVHFQNATLLSDKDMQIIKTAFQRAKSSRDYETIKALREKVHSILKDQSNWDDMRYLTQLIKDYNHLTKD